MEKGINLSLTKSLVDFDALIDTAIKDISSESSVIEDMPDEVWKYQVGKYVKIDIGKEEMPIFWIGYGWEENDNHESCLWIEFDAETCPTKCWDKVNKLVGTTGKYYSGADFEFAQVYMNAWIHFFLKEEYHIQFFDENIDINVQKEILVGFINEVLEKV